MEHSISPNAFGHPCRRSLAEAYYSPFVSIRLVWAGRIDPKRKPPQPSRVALRPSRCSTQCAGQALLPFVVRLGNLPSWRRQRANDISSLPSLHAGAHALLRRNWPARATANAGSLTAHAASSARRPSNLSLPECSGQAIVRCKKSTEPRTGMGSITDQGRPTIKHRFLVCWPLNNRRNLLHRRGCPPCANFCREHLQQRPCTEARIYSITSSARASSEGGMVRLIALAVRRLMTSSNFVGCSTGSSAAFTPRSSRST